jgi:predicted amidohydrolase
MRIALCQIATTSDPDANLRLMADGIEEAVDDGCTLAVFPEATMARFGSPLVEIAQPVTGPWASAVRRMAGDAGLLVVTGMFTPADGGRVRNTLLVTGRGVETRYDKVHLFDAFGSTESRTVAEGHRLVGVVVDGTRIGLATCYDLRFPGMFTELARAGAELIVVPASWGDGPGKVEQWELLVRARAADSTAVVAACDQAEPRSAGLVPVPRAPGGVGHSMVASPFGEMRDGLGDKPGLLMCDVDPSEVRAARERLPVLRHARRWTADHVEFVGR